MPDSRVYRGDRLLGTLSRTGSDMPWWEGTVDAAPEFETLRALVDCEREVLDADQVDQWGKAWDELAEGLRLEPTDGREPITDFLPHIEADGQRATWRY